MDPWTERLSEYLDGDLEPREHAELERHLGGCEECRTLLAELEGVVTQARAVVDPPLAIDLWPGIARRIAERPRGEGAKGWLRRITTAPRLALTLPQLAAGALALVVLTAGGVWLALDRPAPRGPAQIVAGSPTFAAVDLQRYDAAIAQLEGVLRENRAELDTATVRIVEQNLQIIDEATLRARKALAADPGNPYLHGHLAEQMQQKIRVLQRATGAASATI